MAARKQERTETFEAVRPDGTLVRVTRDLDTGEQSVTEVHATDDEK